MPVPKRHQFNCSLAEHFQAMNETCDKSTEGDVEEVVGVSAPPVRVGAIRVQGIRPSASDFEDASTECDEEDIIPAASICKDASTLQWPSL